MDPTPPPQDGFTEGSKSELWAATRQKMAANGKLFYPSVVKKIADEVLLKYLDKQDFDEDESKTWILKISEEIKARVKSVYLPPVGYMLPTHCPPPLPPSLLAHSLPSAPPSAQASATSRVIRWWCR